MSKMSARLSRRLRRKKGIRQHSGLGTPDCPRVSVYRSLQHIYAQIIDDVSGRTLVSASTTDKEFKSDGGTGNVKAAKRVGEILAKRATDAGIQKVQYDRNGFRFQGRVKALADAARKAGLKF